MRRPDEDAPYGVEHLTLGEVEAEPLTWWTAYSGILKESGFTERSRAVVEADSEYIVRNGVLGAGGPGDSAWPGSRVRRGLVMGAVQSGKTASMMAVAAKALDCGVNGVIILGGTRTALWRQTLDRVVQQVDTLEDRHLRRVLLPPRNLPPDAPAGGPAGLYSLTPQLATKLVARNRPLIAVVMKQVAHLEQMAAALDLVYEEIDTCGKPFHLLVMDDEADDSSVVDADSEGAYDALTMQRKQVPRRIMDLWESRRLPGETKVAGLHATYLAYTATPQANFLQDPHNPLAPRDFVASLRTPGASGDFEVRSSTYRDPAGPLKWYTGGEVFYRTLSDVPLCAATDDQPEGDVIRDAVRAYLVACAVRLLRSGATVGPRTAETRSFVSRAEAAIEPMSMLIHPSSAKEDHFDVADSVIAWSAGASAPSGGGFDETDDELGRRLRTAGLKADLEGEPDKWLRWLDDYGRSAGIVRAKFEFADPPAVPGRVEWETIRRLLLAEVIPGTRVAVINSDENADDRPQFSPWYDGSTWRPPRNLSTIFVSGNVMSRGLTLEGLTTSVFARTAGTELADTQMQMQRWFGYRAKIIDLCRVFTSRDQIGLFGQYHENDEALRRDVLKAMSLAGAVPDIRVLQGRSFKATGKISNIRGIPLSPGAKPFVRHLTAPGLEDSNLELVAQQFGDDALRVPARTGGRGVVASTPISLLDAAKLLDGLSYSDHGPGPESDEASRWLSVANHAMLSDDDPLMPLYRAPYVADGLDLGPASPYAIAAYLRLWAACLDRHVPGMMTTDEPAVRWTLVDLEARRAQQPRFWVGLRFGGGSVVERGPLASLPVPVRSMARSTTAETLDASWGSRGSGPDGIVGDEHFESLATGHRFPIAASGARVAGSDGLILFHLIDRGDGQVSLAVGLSIPLGGPDHVQARTRTASE